MLPAHGRDVTRRLEKLREGRGLVGQHRASIRGRVLPYRSLPLRHRQLHRTDVTRIRGRVLHPRRTKVFKWRDK